MISIFAVANFVKGEECGDHCCFVHPRKRTAKNLWLHYEGNDMLSNDKLFRFYNSPFSIYNDKVFSSVPFWLQRRSSIFLSVYSMEFFNFKHGQEKYIHPSTVSFLENGCHDYSGFQEFQHTSQLFILLSRGQISTNYSSSSFYFSFRCVEIISID